MVIGGLQKNYKNRRGMLKVLFIAIVWLSQTVWATEISLKPSQKLELRFDVENIKHIRWYQIIPDTSKFYKNANHH